MGIAILIYGRVSSGATFHGDPSLLWASSPASAYDYLGEAEPMINLPVVNPIVSCPTLVSLDITDVGGAGSVITSAAYVNKSGIPYCSVDGKLATDITFGVLLPLATWTQRYIQSGCGGFCGMVASSVMAGDDSPEVQNGEFVISSNDMAGGNGDGSWGLIRSRRVDFAYLANHLNALATKKIIKAYYGQEPTYSYFNGCSDGGREAVMEAIRYPKDFNGIIAGAPAMMWVIQNTIHHGWQTLANLDANGNNILLSSRGDLVHAAVLKQCDGLDGLVDGLVSEPRLCNFDASSIHCAAGATDTSACLTEAEATVVRKMFTGPVDAATGLPLTQGEGSFGGEGNWNLPASANSSEGRMDMALTTLKYFAFDTPVPDNFTLKDFDFSIATLQKLEARHPLFDATSPDLSAFKAAGGKLILWHGLSDFDMPPAITIAYHEALQWFFGVKGAHQFERLYLLPGVSHCGGGYGMSGIDLVSPMLKWVELGYAPNGIMTKAEQQRPGPGPGPGPGPAPAAAETEVAAFVNRTRPVYPFPTLPKYIGTGDVNDGANYVQGPALSTKSSRRWAGEDFFYPFTPIQG